MDPRTVINVSSGLVEYRQPAMNGVRVVRVYIGSISSNPRLLAFSEDFRQLREQAPMSLWLDEIEAFVNDAKRRLFPSEQGPTTNP
jgi:alpha-beta hydrolase superfamily lysophospholipase